MIGSLRGIIREQRPPRLLIEVAGVGYDVEAPMSTFYVLPKTGQEIMFYTHLLVREDAQLLYGFASEHERRLFRALIKVSGVGAKIALVVLSGMSVDEFSLCIQHEDSTALARLPGIGKKTAERLVVEMRDKLDSSQKTQQEYTGSPDSLVRDVRTDAIQALVSLGYKYTEAERCVGRVATSGLECSEVIRLALKSVVVR